MLPEGYTLVEELSSHNGASVCVARDQVDGELVIIKALVKAKVPSWYREWETLMRLRHSHIVRLFHAIQTPEYLYLIQEYCPHGSLAKRLSARVDNSKMYWHGARDAAQCGRIRERVVHENGGVAPEGCLRRCMAESRTEPVVSHCVQTGFAPEEAKLYFAHIVAAVSFLHSHGFSHGDLKLSNAVLDKNDHIKLVDFGMAQDWQTRVLSTVSVQLAGYGEYGGTQEYMPPEKVSSVSSSSRDRLGTPYKRGSQSSMRSGASASVDEMAADIWALGVVLYSLLVGRKPWIRAALADRGFKYFFQRASFRDPAWHMVGDECRQLILGMLQIDVDKRFTVGDIMAHMRTHWGDEFWAIADEAVDAGVVGPPTSLYITHSVIDVAWRSAVVWIHWLASPFSERWLNWLFRPFPFHLS